ncbi:MAG: hypothetical protein IPJ98_12605 [Bryobacterales bacterium]|nr:hypothetical protein [Bryobacterales bacterium]
MTRQDKIAIALIVLLVSLLWPLAIHKFAWWLTHAQQVDLGNMGTLGDSYGLLTSVFSGVTTLLLLFTIGKQLEAVQAQKDSVSLQQKLFDQQLAEESKRTRHNRTMWLVETYNSPDMRRARSQASALVKGLAGPPPTLSELETEQVAIRARISAGQPLTPSQTLRLDEISSLYTVLFFYDTWAKLKARQYIDNSLALDFFAPAARFYCDHFCKPVLNRHDDTWQPLLQRFVSEIGEPSAHHLAAAEAAKTRP